MIFDNLPSPHSNNPFPARARARFFFFFFVFVTRRSAGRANRTFPPRRDVPGFESVGFYGHSRRRATPPEIVDVSTSVVRKRSGIPRWWERLTAIGAEIEAHAPAAFGKKKKLVASPRHENAPRWSNLGSFGE